MLFKRSLSIAIIIFSTVVLVSPARPLEVDVDEIRTKKVEFINYQGRHHQIDTLFDINNIGKALAKKGRDNDWVRFHMKYSIMRAVSKEEPEKYSADIFSIDRDAKVDHIDNVRRILASYLIKAYGYSAKNARTLSLFLSYYNAIYRGNLKYFFSKYKNTVMRHINDRDAGIALRYDQWPGATRMLIPLTENAKRGSIDSIDPEAISDKKTIEEIRKDKKHIEERKDMADLKEKKIDKDKEKLDEEKKNTAEDRKKIESEKKAITDEKKEIEKKKEIADRTDKEIIKDKEEAKKITDPEKKEKKETEIKKKESELEKSKREIIKKEEDTKKKETAIKEKDKKLEKKEETLQNKEKEIKKKEKDLKEEKENIKKDEKKNDVNREDISSEKEKKLTEKEKELDKREDKLREKEIDKKIYGTKLYYLKVKEYLEGGHYNNELYMIDAEKRKILFLSPVKNIAGRRYDVFSGGVVVITHGGANTSEHHLTLIDRENLEAKIYGSDNIFWRSFVEIRDGFIYAILSVKGTCYLGRFDSSLKLIAKSDAPVNEDSFISFWDPFIYINSQDKKIIVLNKEDLKFTDEVKP
jgi:hypothetical protein